MDHERLPGSSQTILTGLVASAVMIAFCAIFGIALWSEAADGIRELTIVSTSELESELETENREADVIRFSFQPERELRSVNAAGRAIMNRTCLISTAGAKGTGFIFTEDIMVTANHVVENSGDAVTLHCFVFGSNEPTTHTGTVILREPICEVAFIEVRDSPVAGAPPMQFSPTAPQMLEPLHMYGFESNANVPESFIGVRRPASWFASMHQVRLEVFDYEILQLDLLTNTARQGNSGGPVFNSRGQVVGMIIGFINSDAVTLMVPSVIIESLMQFEGYIPTPTEDS